MEYIVVIFMLFLILFVISCLCKDTLEGFNIGGESDDDKECNTEFDSQNRIIEYIHDDSGSGVCQIIQLSLRMNLELLGG